MDCHVAKDRLREERMTAAVQRHLDRCPDCSSFAHELDAGGRELAEAFLAGSPSPGFEDRVAHRLAEREIAVPAVGGRRLMPALVAALLLLVAVGGYFLLGRRAPVAGAPAFLEGPVVVAEVTHPVEENILAIDLDRETTTSPTRLTLEFAGIEDRVLLSEDLEDAIFRLWVRGAHRARLVVGADVPSRDILAVLAVMEKAGFAYTLVRGKAPRTP